MRWAALPGCSWGATWTTLVVAQVAVAVAVLPVAVYTVSEVARMEFSGPGFPAEEFVVAKVDVREADGNVAIPAEDLAERGRARQFALRLRVETEPGVAAVAMSSGIPGLKAAAPSSSRMVTAIVLARPRK